MKLAMAKTSLSITGVNCSYLLNLVRNSPAMPVLWLLDEFWWFDSKLDWQRESRRAIEFVRNEQAALLVLG